MDLSKIDVEKFLIALGIRNVMDEGEEIRFSCPFAGHSNGDETASAYMNATSTAYWCHGCKSTGNAIHFLAKLEGVSPLVAARWIREHYGGGFREPDSGLVSELDAMWTDLAAEDEGEFNSPIRYQMDPLAQGPIDYIIDRGFDPATLEAWEIGYDQLSDRIAIPVRNENGLLIGFKGRAYRPEHQPKYLVLGDRRERATRYGFPTYEVARVVFGLYKVVEHRTAGDLHDKSLVLVEGELNVLALWQHGIYNSVAIGSNISDWQRDMILSHADKVTIFFDDDGAGHHGAAKVIDMLSPYIPVFIVGEHDGDPASLPADESARLIREARAVTDFWIPE